MLRRFTGKLALPFEVVARSTAGLLREVLKVKATPPLKTPVTRSVEGLKELKAHTPGRLHALTTRIQPRPGTFEIQETTGRIHRLMSQAELKAISKTGMIGTKGPVLVEMRKRPHLNLPEHVQENTSSLLHAFSEDPMSAAKYAGVDIMPGVRALVTTAYPEVFTRPAHHFSLDPAPFHQHHIYFQAQELSRAEEDKTAYKPVIHSGLLCQQQKEVDLVKGTKQDPYQFLPHAESMLREVHFLRGGLRNYVFVTTPSPIAYQASLRRDWTIEVLCPTSDKNYETMLKAARDLRMIPPGSRLLTVEDAVAIHPEMTRVYPAVPSFSADGTMHVLKHVPEEYAVGSPRATEFLLAEHSIFRQKHPQTGAVGLKHQRAYRSASDLAFEKYMKEQEKMMEQEALAEEQEQRHGQKIKARL